MFKINLVKVILFVLLVFFSTSCNDSSTGAEDHLDVDGLVLKLNEIEIYQELEGVIMNIIAVGVNDTLELSVHFLDHDGNEIGHEDEVGEEDELSFSISNTDIISIEIEEHDDDHVEEEDHELGFKLIGISSGSSEFTISLMHEGHADYTSLPISVNVQ